LFALQLQQHDATGDAETLAERLKKSFGAEKVEISARVALAEALYRSAYWEFCEHRDWQRFHDGVQRVLQNAPDKWEWLPDLQAMLENLHYLARGEMTPLPQGYDFSEEEQALIKALELFPEPYKNPAPGISSHAWGWNNPVQTLWPIPETWAGQTAFSTRAEHDIRALGMKAFPMLIALCDDFPTQKVSSYFTDSYLEEGYSRSHGSLPFPHPEMRGEKARRILQNTLPYLLLALEDKKAEEITYDSGWPDHGKRAPIKNLASQFYERNKDASPGALALEYLRFPKNSINETALRYLFKQAQTKPLPEFEAFYKNVALDTVKSKEKSIEERFFSQFRDDVFMRTVAGFAVTYAVLREDENILNECADYLDEITDGSPDAGDVHAKLRQLAEQLRGFSLPLSDEDLWRHFKVDTETENDNWRSLSPLVATLLSMRLDALPFKEMYLTVLKNTNPKYPHWPMDELLRKRIEREGGWKKAREMISPTDGRNEWRNLIENAEGWDNHYFYGCLFEEDNFFDLRRKTLAYFWEVKSDDDSEDENLHEKFWTQRFFARLDGVPEEELPPFPWTTGEEPHDD